MLEHCRGLLDDLTKTHTHTHTSRMGSRAPRLFGNQAKRSAQTVCRAITLLKLISRSSFPEWISLLSTETGDSQSFLAKAMSNKLELQ